MLKMKESEFKKLNFKDGDIFWLRGYKDEFYYSKGFITCGSCTLNLGSYSKDLYCYEKTWITKYDVMKVQRYELIHFLDDPDNNFYELETIFERVGEANGRHKF